MLDVLLDGRDKLFNAAEHTAEDAFVGDLAEPTFRQVPRPFFSGRPGGVQSSA